MLNTGRLVLAVLFLAPLTLAGALTAAGSAAMAQGSGCWRTADCRDAPVPAAPSGDFRYGSGTAPRTDFRSPSGEPARAGPRRLDGGLVTEAERRLQQPDNMRFRQYTAPTWPQPIGGSTSAPNTPTKPYGQ